jgi:CDP-4-dehydro-6-deoxyglucose reductase, E1
MKDLKNEIFLKIEEYFKNKEKVESKKIGVAYPCFDHKEVNSALDSLLDVWISQGPKVKLFESMFAEYIDTKFGVACNSGSSANLLALSALIKTGRVKPGSEVIVPAATFTTVISPIIQNGLKPVFVDVEMDTYNINPESIEKAINKNTGLIMAVHSLGCSAKMEEIMKISEKHNIPVLEDCCEAHGSAINNKRTGSFGLISTWSFFVAHNMTSGEGGMILTDDEELDEMLRSIREFGRLTKYEKNKPRFYYNDSELKDYDERYVFTNIGYNLRMTDIAASLGIEQLKKLDNFNIKRVEIAELYNNAFSKYEKYITLPKTPKNYFHSFYGYPIVIKSDKFSRKELVNHLENNNIETRAFMGGDLSKQPAYRDEAWSISGDLQNTQKLFHNGFFIGCHPFITNENIETIINAFNTFFEKYEIVNETEAYCLKHNIDPYTQTI